MRELAQRLSGIPARLEAGMAGAISASAARAAEFARKNAPVDTGELRSSICHSGSGLRAEAAATAPHAGMVEFGTGRTPPRPFMLPAARAVRGELVRQAESCLKEILK